jgi:hypothetical protein
MNVFVVARARCFANVITYIETIWVTEDPQNFDALMSQLVDFKFFRIILLSDTANVPIG